MLKRSLFVVVLACACSPAALPATGRAPSSPSVAGVGATLAPSLAAARTRHGRHVARLAPPFAATGLTRRVPESEPMAVLAAAP